MLRSALAGIAVLLALPPALAATGRSVTTDLHGKTCKSIETGSLSTRRCRGVSGYALLVHEQDGRTSVDIVTPGNAVYHLDYWDLLVPGLSVVGRKAEWHLQRKTPAAVLLRIDTVDQRNPYVHKNATALTVARISADGACVIFSADAGVPGIEEQARAALSDPASKCLGAFGSGN